MCGRMRTIIYLVLLIVCLALPTNSGALPATKDKGFILAQSNSADVELPVLPEPPVPFATSTTTEEKNKEGDNVLPAPPLAPATPPSPTPTPETENTLPPLPPASQLPPTDQEGPSELDSEQAADVEGPVAPKPAGTPAPKRSEKAVQCAQLPKKLEACEAFSCEYPGFEGDAPEFVKKWEVIRKEAKNCIYNESLPGNVTLKCQLSDASRSAFTSYLDLTLVQRKPLKDKDISDKYLKGRTEECQIVGVDGNPIDPKLYDMLSHLPKNVDDYGASDAPKGDCETLQEKLKTCEPFYCKGNDPVQEKFFNRKVEIERKIVGWLDDTCIYVQKSAGKSLVGCKQGKTGETEASQCSTDVLADIAKVGTMFNKLTLAEKAAMNDPTLKAPTTQETTQKKKKKDNNSALLRLADRNYKTQTLPGIIYRRQYDAQNKGLPIARYPEEYKAMAFMALDRNNLGELKSFIDKIKEIDAGRITQNDPLLGGIDIRDDIGNTLLIRSVMAGNIKALRMLVGEGADINARNTSGVTALQAAAYIGREDMVTLLLGMGAKRDIADNYGRTALTHAIEKHYTKITQLLLSQEADPNGVSGTPPLVTAAKLGDIGAVTSLLDNKAMIDVRDNQSKTALMRAAENGHAEIVDILIKRGANIFLQDNTGQTAEVLASAAGRTDIAQLIASAAISKRLGR